MSNGKIKKAMWKITHQEVTTDIPIPDRVTDEKIYEIVIAYEKMVF